MTAKHEVQIPALVHLGGSPVSLERRPSSTHFADDEVEVEESPSRFSMRAYSGGMVTRSWGNLLIDCAGVAFPDRVPTLLSEDPRRPIGVCDRQKHVAGVGIVLAGRMLSSSASPEAALIVRRAREGMPYKGSVGIRLQVVEELESEDDEAEVNGVVFKGPCFIARRSRLTSCSFVLTNSEDPASSAAIGPPKTRTTGARARATRADPTTTTSATDAARGTLARFYGHRLEWLEGVRRLLEEETGANLSNVRLEVGIPPEARALACVLPNFANGTWLVTVSPKIKATRLAVLAILHEFSHIACGRAGLREHEHGRGHGSIFVAATRRLGLIRDGYDLGPGGLAFLKKVKRKVGQWR